jgi:hypothetical protein
VGASLPVVRVGRDVAQLARIDRSLISLRAAVEPIAAVSRPDPLVVYLPGVIRDRTGSPLLESARSSSLAVNKSRPRRRS